MQRYADTTMIRGCLNLKERSIWTIYKDFWTRAFDFRGRSSRAAYWHPFWINMVIAILIGMFTGSVSEGGFDIIGILFSFLITVPTYAVMVRRRHDCGKSGRIIVIYAVLSVLNGIATIWVSTVYLEAMSGVPVSDPSPALGLFLLALILMSLLMSVWMIIMMAQKGEPTANQYGADGSAIYTPEA